MGLDVGKASVNELAAASVSALESISVGSLHLVLGLGDGVVDGSSDLGEGILPLLGDLGLCGFLDFLSAGGTTGADIGKVSNLAGVVSHPFSLDIRNESGKHIIVVNGVKEVIKVKVVEGQVIP